MRVSLSVQNESIIGKWADVIHIIRTSYDVALRTFLVSFVCFVRVLNERRLMNSELIKDL